jgi:hypothetical protein
MNVYVLITVALLILLRNFEPLDFPVFLDGQVTSEMSKMSYRYNDNQYLHTTGGPTAETS